MDHAQIRGEAANFPDKIHRPKGGLRFLDSPYVMVYFCSFCLQSRQQDHHAQNQDA